MMQTPDWKSKRRGGAAARLAAAFAALLKARTAPAQTANLPPHPDTDPNDPERDWSIRDPRVQAIIAKAMAKAEEE